MQIPPPNEITPLLSRWSQGDQAALTQLLPVVYAELRKLAQSYLRRERPDHTLQPTALINEAYLRLVKQDFPEWCVFRLNVNADSGASALTQVW